MKQTEVVKGRVTPAIKRKVRKLAKSTFGGESGVVRDAVEKFVKESK